MKKKIVFTFIGGDNRQKNGIYLLAQEGFRVKVFGFNDIIHENVEIYDVLCGELFDSHVLMLPIPYNNNKGCINIQSIASNLSIEAMFSYINPDTVVILGKADKKFIENAKKYSISYYDILEEESFSVMNAIPSAEGAIQRAMERTEITLHDAKVLVLGYGRIGKVLTRMLKGIGSQVAAAARKNEDIAWIRESGYQAVHINNIDNILSEQDVIFNTIPAMILDRSKLAKVDSKCIIIDLASIPGGVDFDAAKDFGILASHDLSLPGIVAPKTAASIICRVTREILQAHFHYDVMGG